MAGGRSSELPAWAGTMLTVALLLSVLFGAAVAGRIALPPWVGYALAVYVVGTLLAAGWALAIRSK